eukprot:TRINITY_DN6068_c0_g2_i1.p1 TRINITY_DN6068_c0_g2~~TRINITY_DN6068_c0_g2_i1.p1  ORF type:complete len:658 (+),score=107.09 TRINITY_DN6068_c0_g2_i1:67-1974(+)
MLRSLASVRPRAGQSSFSPWTKQRWHERHTLPSLRGDRSVSHATPASKYRSADHEDMGVSHYIRHLKPRVIPKRGLDVLHDPTFNKGTAFSFSERDRLGIRGLVPPCKFDMERQARRIRVWLKQAKNDMDKFMILSSLADRNEILFYSILMEDIEQYAPVVYTPTVGEACLNFGVMYRRPRGMYFCSKDRGQMAAMVWNWPSSEVDMIVVTDGSRVLGLGDLGICGMAIPIGKLQLYVAGGGLHPSRTLPVTIDVGTNNESLLQDEFYLGLKQPRETGPAYHEVIEEFLHAVYSRWPNVTVQFEDFSNVNALPILKKYKHKYRCFNDDIQGTGCVALAGLLSALRAQNLNSSDLCKQRVVTLGAGSAGLGVVNSIAEGMKHEGMEREVAAKNFWMVDADGLITDARKTLDPGQDSYARADGQLGLHSGASLLEVIRAVKPTILLGLSGVGGMFKEEIVREMAKHVEQPVIFPMSNPTKNSECSFENAIEWTDGRVLFASGSPFKDATYKGTTYRPSQSNNMFAFPGIGFGASTSRCRFISDRMFYESAKTLAMLVPEEDLKNGRLYPSVASIRDVSKAVAKRVCEIAFEDGLAGIPVPADLDDLIERRMYHPFYEPLVVQQDTHYKPPDMVGADK